MSPQAETAPEVEVRRSRRRRRTVSAYREGDRIVVLIPASMSKRDEATWVADMVARIQRQERRKHRSDDDLVARAEEAQRPLPRRPGRTEVGPVGHQPERPLGILHSR